MKKISIVIPVYNAEKYVKRTIDALLKQTYSNIELVFIDDGSVDSSAQIILKEAEKDSRIKYFKIKNGGPGNARNVGISKATGEYIGFCDADDIPNEEMFENLVMYLENNDADMSLCDMFSERDNSNYGLPWEDNTVIEGDAISEEIIAAMVGNESDNDKAVPLWGCVWRCLFKKEIIEKFNVKFPTEIHFAEDLIFVLNYLKRASSVTVCNKSLYFYACVESSIMNSFFSYKKDMFKARKILVGYILNAIEDLPCYDELRKRLTVTERCYYQECVGNACRKAEGRTQKDIKAELKEILFDDAVKAAFKNFDATDKKRKLSYLMIQKRMVGAIMFYYKIRFR